MSAAVSHNLLQNFSVETLNPELHPPIQSWNYRLYEETHKIWYQNTKVKIIKLKTESSFIWSFYFKRSNLFLIGEKLLYNVLVSATHQHESAIASLSLETPSLLPSHPRPLGCHNRASGFELPASSTNWLSILHVVMYMFSVTLSIRLLPPLPTLCPQVCSLCLHLHCCPADRFIHIIFLVH